MGRSISFSGFGFLAAFVAVPEAFFFADTAALRVELLLPVVFRFVFAEEDVVLRFLDPSGFLFTAFAVKYSASQSEFPLLLQQEMSCNCNGSSDKAIVGEIFKLLIFHYDQHCLDAYVSNHCCKHHADCINTNL